MIARPHWKPFAFTAITALVVLCGCGGPQEGAQPNVDEGLPPEAIALRTAFESASPSKKGPVREMLGLIRVGSTNRMAYVEVLPQLQKLSTNPTLSPEQKQAVDAVIQKIKADLSSAGG